MATITREQYRANDSFPCGYEVSIVSVAPGVPEYLHDYTTCGTYERACEIMECWAARAARQFDARALKYAGIYVSGCDDGRSYQIKGAFIGF